MCVARVSITLDQDTPLRAEAFESLSGEPRALLGIGLLDVGVYGSSAALRRLALEAVRAAEYAEELASGGVSAARRELAR